MKNFLNWLLSKVTGKTQITLGSSNNWIQYAPSDSRQKFGVYDTNDCWDFSGVKAIAYSMNMLKAKGLLSADALNFFTVNGYLDANGLFAFSERFISIVSGVEGNGNQGEQAGYLGSKYGLIPRSMLTYTDAQSIAHTTYLDFCADYYNPLAITDAMYALGEQFLQYISIEQRRVGTLGTTPDTTTLNNALQVTPLQIGVPVPPNTSLWNNTNIYPYAGMKGMNHLVTMTSINDIGEYFIDDQYNPRYKSLGAGYLLYDVVQYLISPLK